MFNAQVRLRGPHQLAVQTRRIFLYGDYYSYNNNYCYYSSNNIIIILIILITSWLSKRVRMRVCV